MVVSSQISHPITVPVSTWKELNNRQSDAVILIIVEIHVQNCEKHEFLNKHDFFCF